jgi:hypothetical protein
MQLTKLCIVCISLQSQKGISEAIIGLCLIMSSDPQCSTIIDVTIVNIGINFPVK